MPGPLHVLVVEESAQDAVALGDELRGAGFDPQLVHVRGRAGFEQALADRGWDLVLITGPVQTDGQAFGALAGIGVSAAALPGLAAQTAAQTADSAARRRAAAGRLADPTVAGRPRQPT